MSIDKSLVTAGKLNRHRNVFRRHERLAILIKEGRWDDEKGALGLPKVRSIMMKAKPKVKKAAAVAAPVAGAGEAPGAAPAAGKGATAGAKPAVAAAAKGGAPAKK